MILLVSRSEVSECAKERCRNLCHSVALLLSLCERNESNVTVSVVARTRIVSVVKCLQLLESKGL